LEVTANWHELMITRHIAHNELAHCQRTDEAVEHPYSRRTTTQISHTRPSSWSSL